MLLRIKGLLIMIKSCPFCKEEEQLKIITVDMVNIERNIIKCRKCRGEAPLKWWDRAIREGER